MFDGDDFASGALDSFVDHSETPTYDWTMLAMSDPKYCVDGHPGDDSLPNSSNIWY